MKKLEITQEKLWEAFHKHPESRQILKSLFPEELSDKYFDISALKTSNNDLYLFTYDSAVKAGFVDDIFIQIRRTGTLKDKSFFLDDTYNWRIDKDEYGIALLIPTKK